MDACLTNSVKEYNLAKQLDRGVALYKYVWGALFGL